MYVRGYLQGSENFRVVTIEWYATYTCFCAFHQVLWSPPLINWRHDQTEILLRGRVNVMVLKTTLNKISVISWRSVLLDEESIVPEENYQLAANHWHTFYHLKLYRVYLDRIWIRTLNDNVSSAIIIQLPYDHGT